MNKFTDPVVIESNRQAFLALWNSDMPTDELMKASGNKNRKTLLARASRLRKMGYEVSTHRISSKVVAGKNAFVDAWNSDITDRQFQSKYRKPRAILLERAKQLRGKGYEMKERTFHNRPIATSKPDYKPERAMMEEWEIREILGQVRRGVERNIIAELHATSRRYIQWIVDNFSVVSIAKQR